MSTLEHAIVIAAQAHTGQVDKAGEPYILHPLRVMLQMRSAQERIAAVLHDVVEDTPWTFDDLRGEGFSEEIVIAVDALTRRSDESYEAFIKRAMTNPIAKAVKRGDIIDNLDITRISEPIEKDLKRLERYRQALNLLDVKP